MAALQRYCRARPTASIFLQTHDASSPAKTRWSSSPRTGELREQVIASLRSWHERRPDEPGVDSGRLQRSTLPALATGLWNALLQDLLADGTLQRARGGACPVTTMRRRSVNACCWNACSRTCTPVVSIRRCVPWPPTSACRGRGPRHPACRARRTVPGGTGPVLCAGRIAELARSSHGCRRPAVRWMRPPSAMPSAWAANAASRSWSSSIALATLDASVTSIGLAATCSGTRPATERTGTAVLRKACASGHAAGLQTQ